MKKNQLFILPLILTIILLSGCNLMQNKNIDQDHTQQNGSLSSKQENNNTDKYTIIENDIISIEAFLEIENLLSGSKKYFFPMLIPGNYYVIKTNDMYFEMNIVNEDFIKTHSEYIMTNIGNDNNSFIFNIDNKIVSGIDKLDITLKLNDSIDYFNIQGHIIKNKKSIWIDINRYSGVDDTHYDENKDIYKLYTYPLIKECLEEKTDICTDKGCNSKSMRSCIGEKITKDKVINTLVTDYIIQVLNIINSLDI